MYSWDDDLGIPEIPDSDLYIEAFLNVMNYFAESRMQKGDMTCRSTESWPANMTDTTELNVIVLKV